MSNGNGVATTLTNAVEAVADTAKAIGKKVSKSAGGAVKSARKTAKKAAK